MLQRRKKLNFIKLIISTFITLLLLISICVDCFCADYAPLHPFRTKEEWDKLKDNKIEMNEIDALVHEYNNTVINNWNKYENKKTVYDISESYYLAADTAYHSIGEAEGAVAEASAEAKAYGLQQLGDANLDDSTTKYLQYTKEEQDVVFNVKKMYIEYFSKYIAYEIAKTNYEEAKKNYESIKRQFELGNKMQTDVLTAEKTVYNLEAALLTAQNTYENTLKKMLVEIGYSSASNPELEIPKEVKKEDIDKINLAEDINRAKENNFQLKIYNRKLDNASTTEYKNEQQNNINNAIYYIEFDVNNKYRQLINQYAVMEAKLATYNSKEKEFQKHQKEFLLGNRSQRQYETDIANLNLTLYDYLQSKYDLNTAMLTYECAVKGLASTQAA